MYFLSHLYSTSSGAYPISLSSLCSNATFPKPKYQQLQCVQQNHTWSIQKIQTLKLG